METGTSIDNSGYAVIKNVSWFIQFRNGYNPWMARYVYGLMFLLANLLAWAVRDYGRGALTEMRKIKNCKDGVNCLGTEGVLRVSLGCFVSFWISRINIRCFSLLSDTFCCLKLFPKLFYFIMFLSTVGTSKTHSSRDKWHSGWWFAKLLMWPGLIIFPFLLPCSIIDLYGEIAHFGAGVFLLIQLISIISFITWLNEFFQSQKDSERCHVHVMLLATSAYTLCILAVILMYIWYVPDPSCFLNIFFITWTLFLIQLMTSISLHPKVNAGFLTPSLMGLYVVFICWCAIRSEPVGEICNRKAESNGTTDWLTIISFVVALLAMVIATFSTGVDSQCFQFRKDENQEEDAIPYGYGFFHFVFATGAMYFAMLLIGWNIHHSMKKWTIDVGWTSTWVRIVNEWLAVCVYIWMLVAPLVLKCRQTT